MRTVARYQPAVDLGAWIRSATTTAAEIASARRANLRRLGGDVAWAAAEEYGNARQALRRLFCGIAATRPGGEVLLPAHICSSAVEAVRLSGLTPLFLDGDGSYPTPDARQYLSAISSKTAALVVAPLYGYIQADWCALASMPRDCLLVLDLAQGLLLFHSLSPDLAGRCDAVVYSFGIGKGIDTGGGLMLLRARPDGDDDSLPWAGGVATLLKSIAINAAIASGTYPVLVGPLERASESAKADRESYIPRRLHPALHVAWFRKILRFEEEVARARRRAAELLGRPILGSVLRDVDVYGGSGAMHLRQVVRLRSAAARDRAVVSLRKRGIDCAPAGEALPHDGNFPHAAAFAADAIRLPFLGRLSESQFAALTRNLESAIDQRLSG